MILHIIHASTGGTFPIFQQLAQWDEARGHQALAWGTEKPTPALVQEIQDSNLQVSFIRKGRGLDLISWWKIAQYIRRVQPEQIILHSITAWPGLWIAKNWMGCQFKLTVPVHTFPALQTKSEKWMLSDAMRNADKVICFTEEIAAVYRSLAQHPNIQVIPHILDREFWSPAKNRRANECLRIGYHGRLINWKGIFKFPEYVLSLGRPFELELIGEGPDREEFLQACQKAGISDRVKVLPPATRTEIRDWLQTLDIWVCFSQGETMGLSALEAEACGARLMVSGFPVRTHFPTKPQWVEAWIE